MPNSPSNRWRDRLLKSRSSGGLPGCFCPCSRRQERRTVTRVHTPAGSHSVIWNGRDANGAQAATGVYFVRLQAGSYEMTRKIVMLK